MRAGDGRVTGHVAVERRNLNQRQGIIEYRIGLAAVVDQLHRAVPDARQAIRVP